MAPTNKPSEQMVAKLYTNGPAEAGFMGRNEQNQVKLALRYGFTHFTVNEQTQPKLLRNGN